MAQCLHGTTTMVPCLLWMCNTNFRIVPSHGIICSFLKAFAWGPDNAARARALFGDTIFEGERAITMSTSYSGIGTPEYVFDVIGASGTGIRPVHVWNLEKDAVARDELIVAGQLRSPTPCAFDNFADLVPPGVWRRRCGFEKAYPALSPARLRELGLARLQLRDMAPCKSHGCMHAPQRTDVHCAGTSCQDYFLKLLLLVILSEIWNML